MSQLKDHLAALGAAIRRRIAWSIPLGLDPYAKRRASLTVVFAAMFLALALFYTVFSALDGQHGIAILALVTALFMAAAPLAMRVYRSAQVAVHLLMAGACLAITSVAAISGGLAAPVISWFLLVPMAALFLGGRRAGQVWLVATLVVAGVMLGLTYEGLIKPPESANNILHLRRLIALVAGIGMALLMMQLYESKTESLVMDITEKSLEIARGRDDAMAQAAVLSLAQARLIEESDHQRKLEFELRQAQKLEAVGRLASGIAHELNTPLQFVMDSVTFVEESVTELMPLLARYHEVIQRAALADAVEAKALLLAEEAIDLPYLKEHMPPALTRSRDGLQRMATIVKAMKEFAHGEGGERGLLDINRAVSNALLMAHSETKEVADVATELAEGLPQVKCQAGEINQVLLNLIINAAHAIGEKLATENGSEAPARGRITVRTEQRDDRILISVSDTGAGIPMSIRDKIFEPFFTTKEVGKGSGQGLAIARSIIVDKHHGALDFESELGRGTTFTITLPINPVSGTAPRPSVA